MALSVIILIAGQAAPQDTPAQPMPASEPVARAALEQPLELAFDRTCESPALPLDGAPIAALSVDHVPAFTPPSVDAPPAGLRSELLVNELGEVVKARIARPSGKPQWNEAILRWLGEWRFKPRLLDSRAVCAWGTYSLTFEAHPNSESASKPATEESTERREMTQW